jgi:alkylated DNA repair dioxygenase AlkB
MERRELGEGAWIGLAPGFVPGDVALMELLRAALPLQPELLRFFGKEVATPRLTSWHGDPDSAYTYSGKTFAPQPWTPELLALKRRVDEAAATTFNSVLVNYYRDGHDSMGEHADDEPELGPTRDNVLIASVSLGERRRFVLRHRRRKTSEELRLGGGDLLIMGGTTQSHYRHRVPPTTAPMGPRMNLTFRVVVGR